MSLYSVLRSCVDFGSAVPPVEMTNFQSPSHITCTFVSKATKQQVPIIRVVSIQV